MNFSRAKTAAAIAISLIFMLVAALLAVDNACQPVSNRFCHLWLRFQWETVLAGLLGLGGGAFAWIGVVKQIQAQRDDLATSVSASKRRYNIQLTEICVTLAAAASSGLQGFQEFAFPKGTILMVKVQLESVLIPEPPMYSNDELIQNITRLQSLKREAIVFMNAYEPYLTSEEIWHSSTSSIHPKDGHISNILKELQTVSEHLITLADDK
ncbi:hypothetical protein IT893_06560 [Thalassospira sp. A40-3]|uniref:hypothetical protein n=1 Tax=Thalassospira sp. A40-3 TaxID=2785908 RepID=UPI0018CDD4C5|nr:hypothetical protein [Thalassospira sp. A40-3]QPO13171.1 hypothetical protein IT893_06560 [Thalassospira sp. A40-3]